MERHPIRHPEVPLLDRDELTVDEMSKMMAVLAHPGRLKLLLELQACPHSTRGQLADGIQQTPHQVTHLLRTLKKEDLISHRKTGRFMHFAITDPDMDAILKFLGHLMTRGVGVPTD